MLSQHVEAEFEWSDHVKWLISFYCFRFSNGVLVSELNIFSALNAQISNFWTGVDILKYFSTSMKL